MDERSTAGLLWANLGRILSHIYSASSEFFGSWVDIASNIYI